MLRALLFHVAFVLLTLNSAYAAPIIYDIDKSVSRVQFRYLLEGAEITGNFPDFATRLILDLDRISDSRVDVALGATTATGGLLFATDIIRGKSVLDVKNFPVIRFASTKVSAEGPRVKIHGNITVKDVTRPILLTAQLSRPAGSKPSELDTLTLRITGQFKRSEFGVSGYESFVGDLIKIDVTARINKRQ